MESRMKLKQLKKVQFEELTHSYICGDSLLIGVTTLMKKHGLSVNYSGIDPEVINKAAARGTFVHKMLEDYDAGRATMSIYQEESSKMDFIAELESYKRIGLDVLCSEYLVSDSKLVASSIDKVIYVGEKEVDLGDVKTTSTLHLDALAWQLGIYKYLFEKQNKGIKVRKCWGIHVRDGKAKMVEVSPVSGDKVKALLDAEAKGEIYCENKEPVAYADSLLPELTTDLQIYFATIQALEYQIKTIKEQYSAKVEQYYEYMKENNLTSLECEDGGKFIRKSDTTRESIDTAKLKKDYPEIAEKYKKISNVKGSLTYTFKAE